MRNALLIVAGAAAVSALVWWAPVSPPSAAPDSAAPPPVQPVPETATKEPSATLNATLSAAELTRRAQERKDTDPAAALADIERADQLDSSPDPERRALEIALHMRLGHVGHARALTDRFYRAFPANPVIPQLERLTGYHPRPYGPTPQSSQ